MRHAFTIEDTVMLLIDHQVGTIKLAVSTPRDEIVRNTRALARTAVATRMPLVLTSSQEDHFQRLLLDDLQAIAPEAYAARIRRPGVVDAWQYTPFREAAEKSGRKNLVMAGLTNDVCIVYPAISAVEEGYRVQVVVDAGGSPTRAADDAALRRMEKHGVELTSTNQLLAELAMDWASATGSTIQRVMYEYPLRGPPPSKAVRQTPRWGRDDRKPLSPQPPASPGAPAPSGARGATRAPWRRAGHGSPPSTGG